MTEIQINENLKVLAVDDDPFIRKIIAQILPKDCELMTAENQSEFDELLGTYHPHIFLLDLELPDASGLDICRKLREQNEFQDAIILIVTGSTDTKTIEASYDAGADDYIRKPFIAYEFQSKIKNFEKIIRTKSHLNMLYNNELEYSRKLYSLSSVVQKNLEVRDIDSSFRSAEFLYEIIDAVYIELIKIDNEKFKTISRKTILGNNHAKKPEYKTFEELNRTIDLSKDQESNITKVKIKTKNNIVYAYICSLRMNNMLYGYILIETHNRLSPDDTGIIELYMNFFTLMNNRFAIEKIIEDMNKLYRSELSKVRKIQVATLPSFESVKGYDIAATYLPAQDISGDFFDAYLIDENIYQIILCDVSGHGITSSYIGNEIRTIFKISSEPGNTPSQIAKKVNDSISADLEGMAYYCTAVIFQINLENGKISYCNSGHPPILLYRSKEKRIEQLNPTGPLIGLFSDNDYDDSTVTLEQEDCLLLYTDGLTEAYMDSKPGMYGEERLIKNFLNSQGSTSTDINHSIVGSLYEFVEYNDQSDDITIICIRKNKSYGN